MDNKVMDVSLPDISGCIIFWMNDKSCYKVFHKNSGISIRTISLVEACDIAKLLNLSYVINNCLEG